MKSLKFSLAGACALAFASLAMADVNSAPKVYITGSTAFRAATMTAIGNILNSGYTYAYDGSSLNGTTRAIFFGTVNTAGNPEVVIKCFWSGSAAGVKTVSEGQSLTEWMPDTVTLNNGQQTVFTKVAAVPTVCMSDTAQSLTPFTATTLTATQVGVVPFVFVKGRVASGHPIETAFNGVTNINTQQAQALLSSGIDLAQLTGAAADAGNRVYALGRNPESGTRLTTFAETGYGTSNTAVQVQPTTDAGGTTASGAVNQTINNIIYFPAGSVNGIAALAGDNGFSSGGTLADVLSNRVSATASNSIDSVPFGLIGYLGTNDASRAIAAMVVNGGTAADIDHVLGYNGVSLPTFYHTTSSAANFSSNGSTVYAANSVEFDFTPVIQGKYTFWSYEYLMYKSTLSGTPKTAADAIAARILNNDATVSGIKVSTMLASRQVEGGVVTR